MAKPSGLWFREQDNHYYTTVHGIQHKLAEDKTEARKMLHKLLSADNPKPQKKSGLSVRKLCDNYLVRTKDGKAEETHRVQISQIEPFCKALGHRDPATLKVYEVEDWLDKHEPWGSSTKALFIITVKAVFNFGVDQGYLAVNPIKKLKRRSTGKRERVLTRDERERIKAAVNPSFRDFLEFLEQTGARPFSEAAKLSAEDIDFEKGRSFRKKHKTSRKGKKRVLYFPAKLLERLRELAAKYPTGPVLRNARGNGWTKSNVNKYLYRTCDLLGIKRVSAYVFRHSMATESLVRGVPIDVLAELIGNSPAVLRANYSHIEAMDEAMRQAAEKAAGG